MPEVKQSLISQGTGAPAPTYYVPAPYPPDLESDDRGVPLTHYLGILLRHRWKIAAFVATCMAATFIVSSRLTPIYESTAMIDVDRQAPSSIVGQEAQQLGRNDSDQFLATQIKHILSDAVLRPVVQKFDLLRIERRGAQPVPEIVLREANAPVALKSLKVTRPANTYLLFITYRSPDAQVAADVANAIAESYVQHTYNVRISSSINLSKFMEQQLEQLKAKMERSSQALLQFERELNVISPEEKTNILSARLLQLNTEYTIAQGERLKKEAAYDSVKTGSLEAVQVSGQAEQLAELAMKLNGAKQRVVEVRSTFGANHPESRKAISQVTELQRQFEEMRSNAAQRVQVDYDQALNRERMLQKAVQDTKTEFDRLNVRSFEYQQLKRGAEADKKFYEELVRKIKEASINSGFQNNNIRIADVARPGLKPVLPRHSLNLLLAFLLSGMLAVGAAVLSDTLDTTVRDPEQASRYLGADVIGLLPAVKSTIQLSQLALPEPRGVAIANIEQSVNGNGYHRKGYYRTVASFEEAIRTLRNTVLLSDFDAPIRSILITSAGVGEGKTTAAIHLAIAHAERGQRTLLVDGDLRRPTIHRRFNLKGDPGLSSVFTGEAPWREAVLGVEGRLNLSILPAGPASHRAADLVGPRLGELLDELVKEFDLVVLDSPPLLGFAEPLQMATAVDGVLIISRAGETKRKAVRSVLAGLQRVRASVLGVVLNEVKQDTSDGYSHYGYYQSGSYGRRDG